MATDGPAAAPPVGDPAVPVALANEHVNGDHTAANDNAAKPPAAANGNGHADDSPNSDANVSGTVTNRTATLGAIDFLPVRVVLLVDRAQHDIYEVDTTNPKVLIYKPPRGARGMSWPSRKSSWTTFPCSTWRATRSSSTASSRSSWPCCSRGFNAAIYTVNTRDLRDARQWPADFRVAAA
ncbi:hypothetical protein AMAG_19715 [Allomyces macrogynus ATCC 38327]|uniref:Uncharacterized protein n=1 Tax=Allomyces macrogynus (strain ATCC 38327) TaxID=578462 RepID=A0A0L0SZB7_ALLM3|nr:hypothetical protein AMAG_19715 [Allomyces macrogynus ATCC 38327]|eukprot:KNE67841.1 hypothetical protein AMAG_19715 [Allomyces macrogynus ATCC 38327]